MGVEGHLGVLVGDVLPEVVSGALDQAEVLEDRQLDLLVVQHLGVPLVEVRLRNRLVDSEVDRQVHEREVAPSAIAPEAPLGALGRLRAPSQRADRHLRRGQITVALVIARTGGTTTTTDTRFITMAEVMEAIGSTQPGTTGLRSTLRSFTAHRFT